MIDLVLLSRAQLLTPREYMLIYDGESGGQLYLRYLTKQMAILSAAAATAFGLNPALSLREELVRDNETFS